MWDLLIKISFYYGVSIVFGNVGFEDEGGMSFFYGYYLFKE